MPAKFLTTLFPVMCLLYSSSAWGVIWYPLRILAEGGMPGIWSTLVMYLVSLCLGLALSGRHLGEFRRRPWMLAWIAVSSGWTNVAFVLAVLDGNVVRVLLLFYLSPLWTVMFGWFLLQEHITMEFWWIIFLALAGALVMLWVPDLGYPWPQSAPDWLAISSGLAFALSNVFIRRVQDVTVRVKTSASWIGVVVLALILITINGIAVPHISNHLWWGAVALGVFGTFFMTLAVQYGVTHMPVHRSAVIMLFELVAGALSSQWLTDEIVLPREWLGGGLIILAAYLSAHIQVRSNVRTAS